MPFSSATLPAGASEESPRDTARTVVARAIEIVELWGERRHQRRTLRELPDDVLHDMALSSADIEAAASEPFWRA